MISKMWLEFDLCWAEKWAKQGSLDVKQENSFFML